MFPIVDWLMIITTIVTYKSYKKLVFDRYCSISCVPIILNYLIGMPQYTVVYWYKAFIEPMNNVDVRACLKNHSRNLHAPLCGRFCPNSVAVARYGAFIRTKSPTNCDAHLAESLFQTCSSAIYDIYITFAIFVLYPVVCSEVCQCA